MRLVFFTLLMLLSRALIATTVSVEVQDSALRLRALYREGKVAAHTFHHIDLLTAPGAPRIDDYHFLSAEFPLPLGVAVALGALTLKGTALLLYQPLAYAAQSDAHYQSSAVRADSAPDRPNRYGVALSYTGQALALQLSGYAVAGDTEQIAINWAATLSFTEWLKIEQWSTLTTVPDRDYDDWWFRERAYFTATHLFTHALRLHLRLDTAQHAVCSAFLQHSAFHIPQYAFSCAARLRWKAAVGVHGETNAFIGLQSEYYSDETGSVDDEWLIARLRHRQYIGDSAVLTLAGAVGGYKPSHYYRRLTVTDAIPRIELSTDWDHSIAIGDTGSVVRYGTEVDFSYDWRDQDGMRARLRLVPRLSFAVGALLLIQLRASVLYEEPAGWEEFTLSPEIALNIAGSLKATLTAAYQFDIPDRMHDELTLGGKIEWRAAKQLRLYASAAADTLNFSEISDLEYRVGLSAEW